MKKILIALMLIIPLFANAQKDNNLAYIRILHPNITQN